MTVIVVSHDISVILEYANKAAHINKRLSFHDISDKKMMFHPHSQEEHFCEVELLQMLGTQKDRRYAKEENKIKWSTKR